MPLNKKIILCGLNARYVHTNLALRYLKTYVQQHFPDSPEILLLEWTINDPVLSIVQRLYQQGADIYAFSCYIWNIEQISQICRQLKKVLPQARIIWGGPEVSFDSALRLQKEDQVDLIIRGEGENAFHRLLETLYLLKTDLSDIPGLTWRDKETGAVRSNPDGPLLEASDWTFPYSAQDLAKLNNRIVYYETSRGCPFCCSYCLSALDRTVRHRPLPQVFAELDQLIAAHLQQVKLVDRTFNCQPQRALQIWQYLLERKDLIGQTNFHFELAGDLLDTPAINTLNQAPPGLFQLEIGVQSIHADTLRKISRPSRIDLLQHQVRRLREAGRIHLHLDLIAGLPGENLAAFSESLDWIYDLRPQQIQLGFLKILPGSPMREQAKTLGFIWQDEPPYEILQSDALTFSDLIQLKNIEKILDLFYNSGLFIHSFTWLAARWTRPWQFLAELAEWAEQNQFLDKKIGTQERSVLLWQFALANVPGLAGDHWQKTCWRDLVRLDYVFGGQKDQPDWLMFWENSANPADRARLAKARNEIRQRYPDCRRFRIDETAFDWPAFANTFEFCPGKSILFFDLSADRPALLDIQSLNDLY